MLDTQVFYSGFNARGLDFGPGFRSVRQLCRGESQALGRVELTEPLAAEAGRYQVHPVLLDGCVQVLAAALPDDDDEVLYLPIGIARLAVHRRVQSGCWSHAVVTGGSGETARCCGKKILSERSERITSVGAKCSAARLRISRYLANSTRVVNIPSSSRANAE